MSAVVIPHERIENKIYLIRGSKVMFDKDLADLYEVSTKQLTRQVRRHMKRFPPDFLIRLTQEEFKNLRSQFGTSSWGGTRYLPYAFTEQDIAMLSSVLNSDRAIEVNIAIMRAFVKLRELMLTHKELARKLEQLEEKYDSQFQVVFEAIRELMTPSPEPAKRKIGFHKE